jgi:magnesium transporter
MYNAAMIVDSAIYVDGRRVAEPRSLLETCEACREPGKFAWISLREPTEEEFVSVAGELGLDELALEDAIKAHQRPKLERYDERLFVVLKSARYVEDASRIEFGEIHAFVEPDLIVTVLLGEAPALDSLREEMEGEPGRLQRGPAAILYEIMHRVVEGYIPVVEGLENDIDEIEAEVFGGNAGASRRIHELSREVIRFHQATKPLAGALDRLAESAYDLDPETRRHLSRVRDRVLRVTEQTEGFRELISSVVDANLTMVGIRQNDQMQKLSAWGAILIIPTLIAGIFGMNFEQAWWINARYGFEALVVLMVLISVVLYLFFKRRGWL